MLRPFPQGEKSKELWTDYRKDMISYAGISIFIFGNKLVDGKLTTANGVREEFEIARKNGLVLIPIGATGFVAKEFWDLINKDFTSYFPKHPGIESNFALIGNESATNEQLIESVISIINLLNK